MLKKTAVVFLVLLTTLWAQFSTQSLGYTSGGPSLATSPYGAVSAPTVGSPTMGTLQPALTSSPSAKDGLDYFVDEASYYLGAGDQLTAFIWGSRESSITISVTGDGTLIIPTVGAQPLPKKPLVEVKQIIEKQIRRKYKAQSIDIFLSRVKSVEVSVYGDVQSPQIVRVSGATTVASVIAQAGGFNEGANKRKVLVSHQDGTIDTVDVQLLFRTLGALPVYVQSGDRIFVTSRDRVVGVSGAVVYPELFDYRKNTSLKQLLSLAGGLTSSADSTRIIVTRFVDDYDSIEKIIVPYDSAHSFLLHSDDRILASERKEYREVRQVTILGEIEYPGTYAIREDKTHLIDIIKKAGGVTDQAFPEASWIMREDFNDAGGFEYQRLSALPYNELSPDERGYLKYRNSTGGTKKAMVSLNFSDLIQEKDDLNRIILRSGDVITIAKKDLSVNVMGAVVRPGLVPYREGATFDYYIRQAGGYKSEAVKRRERVIKAGTEIWLKPNKVDHIVAGDALWVPEKEYVDGMERTRNILVVITGIATMITATVAIISISQD